MDETHWCGFWRKLLSCCLWFLWCVLEVGKVSVVSIILGQFACWTGSSLWWCGCSAHTWSLYVMIRNFCFADLMVTRSAVFTVNVQDYWFLLLSGLTLFVTYRFVDEAFSIPFSLCVLYRELDIKVIDCLMVDGMMNDRSSTQFRLKHYWLLNAKCDLLNNCWIPIIFGIAENR